MQFSLSVCLERCRREVRLQIVLESMTPCASGQIDFPDFLTTHRQGAERRGALQIWVIDGTASGYLKSQHPTGIQIQILHAPNL